MGQQQGPGILIMTIVLNVYNSTILSQGQGLMDITKVLCLIADYCPEGISENHPNMDPLTLYSLKDKEYIQIGGKGRSGIIYVITPKGWDHVNSNRSKYDN